LPACPYCDVAADEAWIVVEDAVALPHPNPFAACHVVVAPTRHAAAFYDLDVKEQRAVWDLVLDIRRRIVDALPVDTFSIGFADGAGEDAHTHVHLVPRTRGEHIALPAGIEWVDAEAH
jgi:diadenosine tetraphosphate (Ap4A) HIT family hydrolase